MRVTPGSTDVTTYVALTLLADGTDATGLTITDLDLQYVRSGAAPAAKADATALAATDSAHADNKAIEVDATDQPGLYRVDWPDAAFASGVREVILTVKHASCKTAHLRVQLDGQPISMTDEPTPRDCTEIADPTVGDCLMAAFVVATGNEVLNVVSYVRKQPDDTSTFVEFTTNDEDNPTTRTRGAAP